MTRTDIQAHVEAEQLPEHADEWLQTWQVIVDVEISRRKRRHMLYNERGEHLATAADLGDLLDILDAEGRPDFTLHCPGYTKAALCSIVTEPVITQRN